MTALTLQLQLRKKKNLKENYLRLSNIVEK